MPRRCVVDKLIGALVAVALIGLSFWAMRSSWRHRARRDANIVVQRELAPSAQRLSAELLYVASTPQDEPLNRINVPGLGFRGPATLSISDAGILIAVVGEPAVAIERSQLVDVRAADWTIDRGVGPDGLLQLCWTASSGQLLCSSFRASEPQLHAEVRSALTSLLPAQATTTTSEPS